MNCDSFILSDNRSNPQLKRISSAFQSVASVGNTGVQVQFNDKLENVTDFFPSLESVHGNVVISENPKVLQLESVGL